MECKTQTIKTFQFSLNEEEYAALCADLNVVSDLSEVSKEFISAGVENPIEVEESVEQEFETPNY